MVLLAGTILLCLPALINGYPFITPDSFAYVDWGRLLVHALFSNPGQCGELPVRSVGYTLAILPLHWEHTLWPIAGGQALATVGWITFTASRLCPQAGPAPHLALLCGLLLLTPVAAVCTCISPDIFTAFTILGLFWLGPGCIKQSRHSRNALIALTAFAITTHGSNWLLALLMIGVEQLRRRRWQSLMLAAFLLASGTQVGLHLWLYGRPLLFAPHPPFLLAREVEDGLVSRYLNESPEASNFVIYKYRDKLPEKVDDFLWTPSGLRGVLENSGGHDWWQISQQEGALVARIVIEYPQAQLACSWKNWIAQMASFDLQALCPHGTSLFKVTLPKLGQACEDTLQAQGHIPYAEISNWQLLVVLLAIGGLVPLRKCRHRLGTLAAWVMLGVVLNAAICGVLVEPDGRYQARVIWLIPFVVLLQLMV